MRGNKAVSAGLAVIIVTAIVVGLFLQRDYERRTETAATGHLTTMLMLRESVLQSYFESLRSEVILWSTRPIVTDVLKRLNSANADEDQAAVEAIGETDTTEIATASTARAATSLTRRVQEFAEHHGYYDVFFIGPDGDVLFSAAREDEYGTNLIDGPYADSGLGRLFQALMTSSEDIVTMTDFSRYAPSDNEPAAFLGARVMTDGEFIGVYAIQIPEQPISEIMQFSAGMGETGETYLVGQDRLMRSTSRFFTESTVLRTEVSAPTLENAFRDEVGVAVVEDYRGVPVYSAYRLFEFEGIRWAMLAEQDVAEVRASVIRARYWVGGAFVLFCIILLLMRYMLVRIVLPSSIAALLGLSLVAMEGNADT